MAKVVGFGEVMMRLNPEGFRRFVQADRFEASYAGSEANALMTCALCGLDAMMITADKDTFLIISGTGEVIEPDGNVCAIGSGGNYALAAARALYAETDYTAEQIARKALKIASEICVFTNDNIRCETVGEATEKTTPALPSAAEKEREKAEKPAKKTCPKRAARSAKEEE